MIPTPPAAPRPTPSTPPGWYPTPEGGPHLRYFDGRTWTAHTQGMASPAPAPPRRPDAGTAFLLPVGRSGRAIASGYLGLFSVLLVFAPFALATGVMAAVDLKRHPHKLGWARTVFGTGAGVLGTLALLAILLAQ